MTAPSKPVRWGKWQAFLLWVRRPFRTRPSFANTLWAQLLRSGASPACMWVLQHMVDDEEENGT